MLESEILQFSEPFTLFQKWMTEAKQTPSIREPTAMSLATVSPENEPHLRIVLCKDWGPNGFVFFTNYESKKGKDLAANHHVAAVFYWDSLFRQVKIEGTVQRTSRKESEKYWDSRARESQLSQFISRQSEKVGDRAHLEKLWQDAEQQFLNQNIPCPAHWGGYRIEAKSIEFWIGQKGRLHDRFLFEKVFANWTIARLYP